MPLGESAPNWEDVNRVSCEPTNAPTCEDVSPASCEVVRPEISSVSIAAILAVVNDPRAEALRLLICSEVKRLACSVVSAFALAVPRADICVDVRPRTASLRIDAISAVVKVFNPLVVRPRM